MEKRAPRLKFTDGERADPVLEKPILRVQKAATQADKAQAEIPKKTTRTKERVADLTAGKVTTRLKFEEIDKKKPPSMLTHTVRAAPANAVLLQFRRGMQQSEDDNVGIEAAHKSQETAKLSVRAGRSVDRSFRLTPYRNAAKLEQRLDRANLRYLQEKAVRDNPQPSSNPISHWQQKRAVKKQYAAAKRANQTAAYAGKAAESTAKAAKMAVQENIRAAVCITHHHRGILITIGIFIMIALFLNCVSSFFVLLEGGLSGVTISTYPSTDEDMLGAEDAYAAMEATLQNEVNNYETLHPGYDEYRYDLDKIGHDPYVLISLLSAWYGREWTFDEVQDTLAMLFEKQYQLSQIVTTETSDETEYTVCTVTLHNEDLFHLPVFILSEDKVGLYSMYMSTLGNRPDLFPASAYPNASTKKKYTEYDIPPEALKDKQFAAIMKEAEKYLGYPYVWGGSNPTTSFDCSGFVSWVINHSGWNVGRLSAQGLYDICAPVSTTDSKPGDLVFFEHTYDTDGVSHVGIYVGDGMMIAAGNPIGYSNLNASYWQAHFYSFGRLPDQ